MIALDRLSIKRGSSRSPKYRSGWRICSVDAGGSRYRSSTAAQPPSEDREEPPSFLRRLQALRPEIYFLILLLLVLWTGPCQ